MFRPRLLLVLSIAVTTTVFGTRIRNWLPDLSQRDEYRVRTAEITITRRPHWIPHDLVAQVIERSKLPAEMSLLDDSLTQKVAEAFRRHPWVTAVRVRKSVPGRVEVELTYRQPVAMVQVKSGLYPVDAEGVLLPPGDFAAAEVRQYPVIVNIQSTPQGPAGTEWGDVAVVGAARLAAVLAPHWKKFRLAAIHVPRRTKADISIEELVFELLCSGGSRIVWGRAPQSGHPGELSAEQKIGRLKEYLGRYGDFDQPHGPYEIDIRHWQEISRRPLKELSALSFQRSALSFQRLALSRQLSAVSRWEVQGAVFSG